jgi:hypothetical protein
MSPISLAWGAGRLPYDQAVEREASMRAARRGGDARPGAGDPRPWISRLLFEVMEATPMLVDYWSFAGEIQDAARQRDSQGDPHD